MSSGSSCAKSRRPSDSRVMMEGASWKPALGTLFTTPGISIWHDSKTQRSLSGGLSHPPPLLAPVSEIRANAVSDGDDDDDDDEDSLTVARAFRLPYASRRSSASPLVTDRTLALVDLAPRRHSVAFTPAQTPEIKHEVPYRGPLSSPQPKDPANVAAQVERYFSSDDHRTRARELQGAVKAGSSHYKSLHIVEFKACRTDVFFVPEESTLTLHSGDLVIVEADRGRDLGKVVRDNVSLSQVRALKAQQQRDQLAALNQELASPSDPPINPKVIHRMAQPNEVNMLLSKSQDENHAMNVCQAKVLQRQLPMEVLDAEYQWDRRKLTFFYYASQRIDFRELVRDLYKVFKIRIWMCAVNPGISSNLNQSIGPPGAVGQRLFPADQSVAAVYHDLPRLSHSWQQPATGTW